MNYNLKKLLFDMIGLQKYNVKYAFKSIERGRWIMNKTSNFRWTLAGLMFFITFISYMDRVNLCNERYSVINRAGMKTDRGRIYILYGEPDEIERYPNDIDKKPYEIWHYNRLEGGVYFIFGDVSGFSNYELLHSTKRGELRDDYWQRRISVQ